MSDTLIDDIKIVISAEDKAAEGQIDKLIDKLEDLTKAAQKANKMADPGAKVKKSMDEAVTEAKKTVESEGEVAKAKERSATATEKTAKVAEKATKSARALERAEEKHQAALDVSAARKKVYDEQVTQIQKKAAAEQERLDKAFASKEKFNAEKRANDLVTAETRAEKEKAALRERTAKAETAELRKRSAEEAAADKAARKASLAGIEEEYKRYKALDDRKKKLDYLSTKMSPEDLASKIGIEEYRSYALKKIADAWDKAPEGKPSGGAMPEATRELDKAPSERWLTFLDAVTEKAAAAGKALGSKLAAGAKKAAKEFGIFSAKALTFPFSAITSNIGKFGNAVSKLFSKIKSVIMYRAIRSAIRMVTDGFREGTNNAYQWSKAMGGTFAASMDSLATSSLYLKNSLGALATPIINAIAPAVDYVIDKFVALLNIINMTIARLTGASTWTKAIKYPKAYADAANQAAGSTGKLAKALVTILSIDELNPLNGDNGSGGGGGGGTGSALDYSSMFEEVEQTSGKLEGLFDPIKKAWDNKGQAVMDSIQNALNGVKSLVESVGASFWEVWTNGTGQQTVEHLLGIFTGINNTIGNIASQLAKGWNTDNLGTKIIQNLWNVLNDILGTWDDIANTTAEWAKGLDFVPLLTALEKVSGALEPVVDTITKGLKWAWENVLLPFGKWTIEDALPAGLNLIGSALEVLNPLLEALGRIFQPIWDNIIVPIAGTIGKAVVDFINWVADGLEKIAEWIKSLEGKSLGEILSGFLGTGEGMESSTAAFVPLQFVVEKVVDKIPAADKFIGGVKALFGVNGGTESGFSNLIGGLTAKFKTNGGTETGFSKTITGLIAKFTGKPVDGMTTAQKTLNATANFIKRTTNWTNPSIGTIWNATANFIKRTTNWADGSTTWKSTANFTTRTDSLGASKKTFSTTASFSKVSDGLTTGQKSFYTTANFNKVSDGLTSGQKSFYSLANFNKVSDGLTTGQKSFYATANFNKAVNNLSEGQRTVDDGILKIRTLKLNGNTYTPINAKGGAFYGGSWHPISQYATGGVPDHGSLFMAGEAGAEVVGHVGGRTEVLNQSQIASTIAAATQMSNESQNGLLRQLLAVGEQILEGQGDVRAYIPAGEVVNGLQRNNRRDGRTLIPMGV